MGISRLDPARQAAPLNVHPVRALVIDVCARDEILRLGTHWTVYLLMFSLDFSAAAHAEWAVSDQEARN